MSGFSEKVKRWVDNCEKINALIQETASDLGCGPASFYIEKLAVAANILFERYAPFKVGDKVILLTAPECKGGWAGFESVLCVGRTGIVATVDIDSRINDFTILFRPDGQEQIRGDNKEHWSYFNLAASRFAKVPT